MKSVLIVGAGPAGLVAAKTLLHHVGNANFSVTVFEAAERVGGMWRALPGEQGDKCSPYMRTNLSRFTVSFPDLSWSSVDLSDPETSSDPSRAVPMFPKAWQVGRYLEAYARKFLPEGVVRLNRRVTGAHTDSSGTSDTWNVTSVDVLTQQVSKDAFDYLIVASGFFDRPAHAVRRTQELGSEANARIQHSSKFRNVSSFADTSGKIVVIGGGISGCEAAATAAFQISNAKHAPGKQKPAWAQNVVHHVFNKPFYCLPRYLPQTPYNPAIQGFNLSPTFLPLDLVLYDLARRGDGPIVASNGPMPSAKARKGHEFIRSMIGGDQRDTGRSELVYKPDETQHPPFTGITDTYNGFVQSGLIVPVRGRAVYITPFANEMSASIEVVSQGLWADTEHETSFPIEDVTGIIEATGFEVHLDYLDDSIKQALDYEPDSHRVPFLLSRGSVFSPNVSNIAFVGFYEGPYWEVMEMQARRIAQTWAASCMDGSAAESFDTSESRSVRRAIKDRSPDVPQFWMADYVGLIEEFASKVGLSRDDSAFTGQTGPVFPARYRPLDTHAESPGTIREVADTLQQSKDKARFVACAAFRGMQGQWTLQRKIDSRHSSMPGGSFEGTAHFHARDPTAWSYAAEYLYIEEGTLKMDNGMSFPASRRYIYRYNESTDTITAWFAKDDGLTIDTLFNTWEFYAPSDTYHGWLAKGSHWCSPDTYKNNCEFRFRGASLEMFGITYDVSGPKKDYSHESWYSRPELGGD